MLNSAGFFVKNAKFFQCKITETKIFVLFSLNRYGLEVHGTSCTINYSLSDESYQSFIFFLAVFSFVFPMISGWYAVTKAWSSLSSIPDAEKEKDKDILSEEQLTAVSKTVKLDKEILKIHKIHLKYSENCFSKLSK